MLLINKMLLKMAKGLWSWIIVITLLKMLVLAGTAGFAKTLSGFLGNITDPSLSVREFSQAALWALLNALLILAGELLTGRAEYLCAAKARISLRRRIFEKILLLDVGKIEKTGGPGAVLAAAVDGVEAMQLYYVKYLPGLCYCFLAPGYLFFRLEAASRKTAFFLLAVTLILVPANNLFRGIVQKLKDRYWTSFRNLTAYYLESLQNLTAIKLFNQDERRTETLKARADDFNCGIMAVMRSNFRSFLFSDGVIYTSIGIAALIVTGQIKNGTVPLSSGLLTLMLSYSFFTSIRQLMSAAHQALAGIAASQNIAEFLDIDPSRPSKPFETRPEKDGFTGIRLSNVAYSYTGREPAVQDISLDIPKGKVTALAGPSGCGKSTLAGLLARFFDPLPGGTITMEGTDYLCFSPDELRRRISMVPQQVGIFSGSVADNLRIAKPGAGEAEMLEALDLAGLKNWVLSLPEGLAADVGDGGAKLSGGQRQKIGIARVLLRDAPYIIFDEATSSVDPESEREIWACIANLARTRTLIIISHRLSAIRNADVIYVLEKGRLTGGGRHQELMARNGLYRQLVLEQEALERYGEAARIKAAYGRARAGTEKKELTL
jgi:ATP-binding cassette subfamily C protein